MLNLHDGPLDGSLSDGNEVGSNLLVNGGQALAVLSTEVGLLLVVDDLVEARVHAIREGLLMLTYQ